MKYLVVGFIFFLCFAPLAKAQKITITGKVSDATTMEYLKDVQLSLSGVSFIKKTNKEGVFTFENISKGAYLLNISKNGYDPQRITIKVGNDSLNLGTLFLFAVSSPENQAGIISLTEEELSNDNDESDNITGLLQYSRDVFLNAAAFNFGQSWFKVRGLGSENGTVLINGIPMNKLFNGRPQWSNWGGLNDAMRNQLVSNGVAPNNYNFGGILGTTSISTQASEYRPGTRVTLSAANKSYVGRMMATHASGLKSKWAYIVSASRRFAKEGFVNGSFYDANAAFASVEYQPNEHHSINLTAIYAYNRRGKSSANTDEVFELKGKRYNSYWGYQEGKNRNSRVKEIEEPIVMLSYALNMNEKIRWQSSVSYQFGKTGNSRLGYFNAPNPDPTYYKYLPSYYLRDFNATPELANRAASLFKKDPNYHQINWGKLYQINKEYGTARYYVYEDRNDDQQLSANSVLSARLSDHINLDFGGSYQQLSSKNYAKMLDLLGSSHFEDIDQYTLTKSNLDGDTSIKKGDTFLYNYLFTASVLNAFLQGQFTFYKLNFYATLGWSSTEYQREGLFTNELYKENSFGKGTLISFKNNISAKLGATYKITGRHLIDVNAAFVNQAPSLQNTYPNARVNHDVTLGVREEKIKTIDVSYWLRTPKIKSRLTAYYTQFENSTNIARYFNQSLGDFISEVTTGINKKHWGMELGTEYKITSTVKAIIAAAAGKYTYDNNPTLYYTSDKIRTENTSPETSFLKGYKISGTPQTALSFGLEYRDPRYWWIGANVNYFSNTYVNISPGLRTKKFYINPDTNEPFKRVEQEDLDKILQQEKFKPYNLVNIMGGKSWRIKDKYIGIFATINNVFNILYKTNGYEQARNGNYKLLLEDQARKHPLFGSKYWYGYGTTFFINAYVNF